MCHTMKLRRSRGASGGGQTIGQVLEGELSPEEWENAASAQGRAAWAEEVHPGGVGGVGGGGGGVVWTGICEVCVWEKNSFHREEVKYSLPRHKTLHSN